MVEGGLGFGLRSWLAMAAGIAVVACLMGCPSASENPFVSSTVTGKSSDSTGSQDGTEATSDETASTEQTNGSNEGGGDDSATAGETTVSNDTDDSDTDDDTDLTTGSGATGSDYYYLMIVPDQTLYTAVNTPLSINLCGTELSSVGVEGHVYAGPYYGTAKLYGSKPFVVYTPNPGFKGKDAIAFYLIDGMYMSDLAFVYIYVGQ
jgi:hypothetical protein